MPPLRAPRSLEDHGSCCSHQALSPHPAPTRLAAEPGVTMTPYVERTIAFQFQSRVAQVGAASGSIFEFQRSFH